MADHIFTPGATFILPSGCARGTVEALLSDHPRIDGADPFEDGDGPLIAVIRAPASRVLVHCEDGSPESWRAIMDDLDSIEPLVDSCVRGGREPDICLWAETFGHDWRRLEKFMGWKSQTIPHVRRSKHRPPITAEDVEEINAHFAADVDFVARRRGRNAWKI